MNVALDYFTAHEQSQPWWALEVPDCEELAYIGTVCRLPGAPGGAARRMKWGVRNGKPFAQWIDTWPGGE